MKQHSGKLMFGLVVLLLIANTATLTYFWFRRPGPPPGGGQPKNILVKELGLSKEQEHQLDTLIREHRRKADALHQLIRAEKEALFELAKASNTPDSIKLAAAQRVSALTEKMDLLTLEHFTAIRQQCTPEQQVRFDAFLKEMSRLPPAAPPGAPDGMPPPPPEKH